MKKFDGIIHIIRNWYKGQDIIPLHNPVFIGNEKKYLEDCIDTTYVSSIGKYTDLFEKKVASYTGARNAVVTVNGTSALHIALKLLDVNDSCEVVTQPLTFIGTVNAIAYTGASPVFVDVDKETLGLSPEKLEDFLKNNAEVRDDELCYNQRTKKRIAACIPMHTFGHPVQLDEIIRICDNYNIEVVEDAAEAIGSYYKRKHVGVLGKVGILSFNGNKTITTGGGGMILTNDDELSRKAKHMTTTAKVPHAWEFVHDMIGYNYRMPNINAALGCAQMEKIDHLLRVKRELAQYYRDSFGKIGIGYVWEPKDCKSNFWLNEIILENKEERNDFLEYTNFRGVMTRPIWKLANELIMYNNCQFNSLATAKWLEERIVNIPSSVKTNA